ncbi:MAG TPA: IspD/TarI family cytidylyltransferase, partial [Elusimicrobiota bacterium]|nr:IspD/TarI family cytidylyltransferase [Elusimicrobiota bacterium]
FRSLSGRPLLYWPLRSFEKSPSVKQVVLVVSAARLPWARRFLRECRFWKVTAVVAGGRERMDSVLRGFAAVPSSTDVVLFHDAARALVSPGVIERVARSARRTGAALAAWPVPDTVKLGRAPRRGKVLVARTVPRRNLWLAQTPQGFTRAVAEKIFRRSRRNITDDVQWAERAGRSVEIVPGSPENLKVTLPEDFKLCEALLAARKRVSR